jgi:hypothetical protein
MAICGNLKCTDGRTSSVRTGRLKSVNKTNTHRNLGVVIHLKGEIFHQIYIWRVKFQWFIKRDRWHNLMEISMYGRLNFVRPYGTKVDRQTNTHRKPGVIKRDRWHNLMEISMYGRTDTVRRTEHEQRQTHTENLGVIHLKELKFPSRFVRN